MSNSYYQVYIQIVFAVKFRAVVLDKKWRAGVFAYMGNLINESKCKCIIVNGVEDHVHCLVGLHPNVPISELVKKIKGKSSKYINDTSLTANRFEWQEGYSAFSYNKSKLKEVYNYIKNQEEHHKKQTLEEEYRNLFIL